MLNEQLKIPNHIKIIAVSKLQPIEKINQLIDEGHFIFGENYVQEALDKIDQLNNNKIEWHFIGSLQKNKVKFVVGQFAYIHSVDSLGLLQKIQQIAYEKKTIQKIFLQINIAKEISKGGFAPVELSQILNEIQS